MALSMSYFYLFLLNLCWFQFKQEKKSRRARTVYMYIVSLTITLTHTTNLHPNLIRVYAFESPRYTYYHFTTPLSLAKHVAFRIMYRPLL